MSEVVRLWGPETAARRPSTDDSLDPIALKARIAEARARRTQLLAAKSGDPALIPAPPAAPIAAARAFPYEPPAFLTGLAVGLIAAAISYFWIVDPFAEPATDDTAPQVITVSPAVPAQPADVQTHPLPLATSDFLRGAPIIAPVAPTDFPETPVLSAPSRETVDAALVDEGLRPGTEAWAELLPAVAGQQLLPFRRERVPADPAPDAPTASDVPMAGLAPVSRAAFSPASAVIPSLAVGLPAATRELPAAAREFPLSDDGPNYTPSMICYRASCYFSRPIHQTAAKPAAVPVVKTPTVPVAHPTEQQRASAPATPMDGLPDAPENPTLGGVQALPATPVTRPVVEAPTTAPAPGRSAAKVPIRTEASAAAPKTSVQRTRSSSEKARSGGKAGGHAENPRSQGQRASKSGAGPHATRSTGQARGASAATGKKEGGSLSSESPGRGAQGRKSSGEGTSPSDSGDGGSHGNPGKSGSSNGAGKSGGGSKGGSGSKGGGGGKGKGGGRH